jgi:hypothetical protein
MKTILSFVIFLCACVILCATGCQVDEQPKKEPAGPGPMHTVNQLLRLHDLLGRQPEERSPASRNKVVDPKALDALIFDFGDYDPFIRDLYVGFVTGALARSQGRLFVTKQGERAEVSSGRLRIKMARAGDLYQIILKESIPEEIKKRARLEKAKFDQARGAAQQAM